MAENELQILIKGIFSRIKEKYGYTEEQALIYLKGCEDCAKEHQQSLEKRDKMLRDTVAELCEAKRLLKAAVEDMSEKNFCVKVCKRDNFACRVSDTCDFKWRYADEAEKLLKDEELIM